jgi:hypothetical protein
MAKRKSQPERPKPFMLRLTEEDRALFIAAAAEDGFEQLSAWFRWLAKSRAKKVLTGIPQP